MPVGDLAAVLSAALIAALPTDSAANGRFPAATSATLDRSGSAVLVGTTFGPLLSTDGGEHFAWICEQAIGYGGTFDPTFAVADDGALYATTFEGLRRSTDGGCSWDTVPLGFHAAGQWVTDVAIGDDGHLWVTTATTAQDNDVFVDRKDGNGFVGTGLETPTGWWKSIAVAPGNPGRVYAAGYQVSGAAQPPAVFLRRTEDGGQSWAVLPTDSFALGPEPLLRVAAISPTDPSLVFVISSGAATTSGDLLYRSTDGGESWEQVLEVGDVITAVAALADGRVVAATIVDGMRVSPAQGAPGTFAALSNPPRAACLAVAPSGPLYSCGANWGPEEFALGRSNDLSRWSPVVRFQDIDGPLACPGSSPQAQVCASQVWPGICSQLDLCSDDGIGRDAGPHVKANDGCGCNSVAAGLAFFPLIGWRRRRPRPSTRR